MNKRKSGKNYRPPRLLSYGLVSNMPSNMGQKYTVSHRVVVQERPIAVTVITTEPGKGVCEGIFFPDGTVRFMEHAEFTRKDGVLFSSGTVLENFDLPEDIAFVVKAIQQGPNAERAKWRRQCPCKVTS